MFLKSFKTQLYYIFTEGVVYVWTRLPGEVMSQSSVSEFKHDWGKHRCILKQKVYKKINKRKDRLDRPLGVFLLSHFNVHILQSTW